MSLSSIRAFSHFGLCVSDVARSKRFYCDGLGFREVVAFRVGNEVGVTMEVAGDIVLDSVFVRRDGVSIELLGFQKPKPRGDGKRRAMDLLGLTHMSLLVDDVDAVSRRAVEHGGSVVETTRAATAAGDFVFVLDPDGTRVELMRLEAGPVPTGD